MWRDSTYAMLTRVLGHIFVQPSVLSWMKEKKKYPLRKVEAVINYKVETNARVSSVFTLCLIGIIMWKDATAVTWLRGLCTKQYEKMQYSRPRPPPPLPDVQLGLFCMGRLHAVCCGCLKQRKIICLMTIHHQPSVIHKIFRALAVSLNSSMFCPVTSILITIFHIFYLFVCLFVVVALI